MTNSYTKQIQQVLTILVNKASADSPEWRFKYLPEAVQALSNLIKEARISELEKILRDVPASRRDFSVQPAEWIGGWNSHRAEFSKIVDERLSELNKAKESK